MTAARTICLAAVMLAAVPGAQAAGLCYGLTNAQCVAAYRDAESACKGEPACMVHRMRIDGAAYRAENHQRRLDLAADRDRQIAHEQWTAYCKPRVVIGQDGIGRYVYAHAGCENGQIVGGRKP
jgi:hypothetical protein